MNGKQRSTLTKIFAISGMVALWAPILFLILTAIAGSIAQGRLLADYLMLAELFPLVALGLALLVTASLLAHTYRKWFGWGAVAALLALSGSQIYATVSGLASGELVDTSLAYPIVIAGILVYNVIILALAILSIVLVKKLFQKQQEANTAAE